MPFRLDPIGSPPRRRSGPFNYLESCGTLKERYRNELRDNGLSWLHEGLVREAVRKIAVGNVDANLKEQVCPPFRF